MSSSSETNILSGPPSGGRSMRSSQTTSQKLLDEHEIGIPDAEPAGVEDPGDPSAPMAMVGACPFLRMGEVSAGRERNQWMSV